MRRVSVKVIRRHCVADDLGALVCVDFARVSLLDALDLHRQILDLAKVVRVHLIVVMDVPIV